MNEMSSAPQNVPQQIVNQDDGGDSQVEAKQHMDMDKDRGRILRIDEYYSKRKRMTQYAKSTKVDVKIREKFRRYTLVIRQIINTKGLPQRIEIDVKSTAVAAVLKTVFRGAETLMLAESEDSPMVSPDALFLAWDQLEAAQTEEKSKKTPNAQSIEDISVALDYLEKDHGEKRIKLKAFLSEGLITFDLLGLIFPPHSMLYTGKNDLQEHQVLKFASGKVVEKPNGDIVYQVKAYMMNSDGEGFGWAKTTLEIPSFEGKMVVTDLQVFPFSMHPQRDSIYDQLVSRGRYYVELIEAPVCKWYDTMAVRSKQHRMMEWEEVKFLARKRVMIDPGAWMIHNHNWDSLRYPIVNRKQPGLELVKDEDLVCCNHRVLGFSFEAKLWGAFAVSRLQDPNWDKMAFDKVILPLGQRDLVRDLVLSHQSETRAVEGDAVHQDDIIKGKGKGLVGLLSGSPGVGKTLTAEAVSEVSRRPLYAITAGEMGTAVDVVDGRLNLVFDLTHRWRCVLLIDEADVFLHKREDDISLERNTLVSVFLRRLEYFQGLALLTTNRKKDIDVAFMSRIHFKFDYVDLDSNTRFEIWKNFLVEEVSGARPSIDLEQLQELARLYKLSGREIKNATFCARSIGRTRKEALTVDLVKTTVETLGFGSITDAD